MGSFQRPDKMEVCEHFLEDLRQQPELGRGLAEPEDIKLHFEMLSKGYARGVTNLADVLEHKRLLDSARADPATIFFQVRCVNVLLGYIGQESSSLSPVGQSLLGASTERVRRGSRNSPGVLLLTVRYL